MKSRKSLVKLVTLSTLTSIVLSGAPVINAHAQEEGNFFDWYTEETVWRTVQNSEENQGGFIEEEAGKPSEGDIQTILEFAALAPTSTGKQDFYMVAVTDPAEQETIIGDRYGKAVSEGTVTILVYSERLIRDEYRTDVTEEDIDSEEFTSKFAPDRGYYNSGLVSGYLNIGATSLGYGTHMYMSPALPGNNGFDEGSRGTDAYKYLENSEYYDSFLEENLSTENMKFVCAIVVGTPNEEALADTVSGVTLKERPGNFHVYSGQEGESQEMTQGITETEEIEETTEEAETESVASENGNVLTGEAEGFNGPIVVEVEVDGDTIIDIRLVSHDETPTVGSKAFDELIPAIIANNGVEGIEVTSGASYTSQGIIDAVKNALENN